jgi:hypothetical protein
LKIEGSDGALGSAVDKRHYGMEGEATMRFVSEVITRVRERVKGGAVVTSAFLKPAAAA